MTDSEKKIRADERQEVLYLLEELSPEKDYSTGYSALEEGWQDGVNDAAEAIKKRMKAQAA